MDTPEAHATTAPGATTVLSIDVGRKNLALCAVAAGECPRGTRDLVEHWTVTACEPTALGIKDCLDRLPWTAGTDDVVIERQPNRNATMSRLQHYLEMYFVERGKPVTVQDASHKLAFAAGTPWWPAGLADNWSYHTRKKLAVHTARAFLDATPQSQEFKALFASTKKADDLADSLLQGMAYCHHVRPLQVHKRQRACARAVKPRKPSAAQLASGKLSAPNAVHFLKGCGSVEAVRAAMDGNKALAKAVDKHFGGADSNQLMESLGIDCPQHDP